MIARLVVVKCLPERVNDFVRVARGGLQFYREQPGCRGVQLMRSRGEPTHLIAMSLWDRESDLLAARAKPEYQQAMAGLADTYSEPQSVGEWDQIDL
jgi:quinol monooxygenase YgiN